MKQHCTADYNTIYNVLCEGKVPQVVAKLLWETRSQSELITSARYDSFIDTINTELQKKK